MRKQTIDETKRCPACKRIDNQIKKGYNRSGTQRCLCKVCGVAYTLEPKQNAYSEETKSLALKIYYSGVSGRGVGKILRMSKANVYNWIKKPDNLWISEQTNLEIFELDELYRFIERKANTETRENTYIMTLVSRLPRQIVGYDVAYDKSPDRRQAIVDSAPEAKTYCTDGCLGYVDVVYPGKHIRNIRNKKDTYTVEGVNADLRHYIPILARRSRCFARKPETLQAVIEVFADAYNKFGEAKYKYRKKRLTGEIPFGVVDFL